MSEAVELKILTRAAEHLRRDGAEFMRVTNIARDLGMTHANIYRHFASKEALIDEVLHFWLKTLEKRLRDIVDSPDPADDKLERFIWLLAHAYREKNENDPYFYKQFRHAWLNNRESVEIHRATLRRMLERILDEGDNPGNFHLKSLEKAASLIGDLAHRFINPELIYELRELNKTAFDARLTLVLKVLIRALQAGGI